MTARSSAVSRAGRNRWRPAHASGSPSGPSTTTPRSTPRVRVPDRTASRSSSNAASRVRSAAVMPRPASRRASVTAEASASLSCDESRGTRPARTSRQQHSMCRTRSVEPLGRGHGDGAARERYVSPPLHLKSLVPDEVRFILERDARLLVPVGTCEQHGPHLPLGCDTIIVECLADDLSGALEILRAPTIGYGVNTSIKRPFPGNASVRRKTLHRWMNDLLGSWEQAGVDTFIILTAHGHDPHQEALSTLRTHQARIFTVDVFDLDFSGLLEDGDGPMHGSELDTSLLLYLAPELVRMERAQDFLLPERQITRYQRTRLDALPKGSPGSLGRPSLATREKGERLYKMIRERIATRVLGAPVA